MAHSTWFCYSGWRLFYLFPIHPTYLRILLTMSKNGFVLILSVMALYGCQSTFGPSALENTHPAYNQAIATSIDQQMLLNLVRLKYGDSPYFLDVGSVTASLALTGSVGVESSSNLDDGINIIQPNIGVEYVDRPTISYSPLHGEDFLKSVLSPLPLESILVMTQSGWSIERVFAVTIERINDLHNAPRASGPTPEREPQYKEFKRLLYLLRDLQNENLIEIGPALALDKNSSDLVILLNTEPAHQTTIDEINLLLGIVGEKQTNRFKISTNFLDKTSDKWNVRPRSIASVLFYLSQNVEIPQEHFDAGLVTRTRTKDGKPFDWHDTPAGIVFQVKSSKTKPSNAYLSIPYRGRWFYILDNDLQSKSTFMLVEQLFNLQAGQRKVSGPTLTLPVNR